MALSFEVLSRSAACRARRGRVTTPHGAFDTPAFMPVGTRGTVKGVLPHLLAASGAQICLANTYHMLLRPGPERVAKLGGLQKMMNWPGPILTDSGGYQAYSMADTNRLSEHAVTFKSIVDGSVIELTPERAMATQNALGADIIMALDDCPPSLSRPEAGGPGGEDADAGPQVAPGSAPTGPTGPTAPPAPPGPADPRLSRVLRRDRVLSPAEHAARLRQANERTVRWLERCKAAHARAGDQALFGIVQGGTDPEQRTWSVQRVCAIELPGYAIGGVAVGESSADIARVVAHTAPQMPDSKPRYLMGVGYERDLLAAVRAGVDMFDCVLPTRNGRNANAFTPTGQLRLRNARFADDTGPIEPGCDCVACAGWAAPGVAGLDGGEGRGARVGAERGHFGRGYLRHLFMADEMLGPMLVSLHNLRYFQRFMAALRQTIDTGDWTGLLARYPVAAPAE